MSNLFDNATTKPSKSPFDESRVDRPEFRSTRLGRALHMKNLTIAWMAVAAITSVGCKEKGGGAGDAMAKMTAFKDQMCACKDPTCAQGVQDEVTKWLQENVADKKSEPRSEDEQKKYTEATTEMARCAQTAMSGRGGGAAPGTAAAGSAAAAPSAGTAKVGEGPVVPAKALALFDLPAFKGVPESALWTSVAAEKDGDKFANLYVYGEGDEKEGYVSIRIIDCNSPALKKYVDEPENSGDFSHCFKTPAADARKVGAYPRLDAADDSQVVIKVDHLIVRMGIWAGKEDKIKKDDLAAYLATADFKSLLAEAK